MYGVLRIYDNAPGLVDAILERQDEARALFMAIKGFRQWGLLRTANGGMSFTQCDTAEGCAESVTVAANWLKQNYPDRNWPAPTVHEGEVILAFSAGKPTAIPPARVTIFNQPGPPDAAQRADEVRQVVSSVPGYRSYTFMRTARGAVHGLVVDNFSDADAIRDKLRAWMQTNYPSFSRPDPRVIDCQPVARSRIHGTASYWRPRDASASLQYNRLRSKTRNAMIPSQGAPCTFEEWVPGDQMTVRRAGWRMCRRSRDDKIERGR